jgi:hypothetical protein
LKRSRPHGRIYEELGVVPYAAALAAIALAGVLAPALAAPPKEYLRVLD